MNEEIRRHLLETLAQAAEILQKREEGDINHLKELSDHTITDASLYQDIDAVSVAIITYSLFKIVRDFSEKDYQRVYQELRSAQDSLQKKDYPRYNQSIKNLFSVIRSCEGKICKTDRSREYAQEVFHAARIKKGLSIFKHGLSIGKAAEIMGISSWDLMDYIGKTKVSEEYSETLSSKKRLASALQLFST